MFKLRRFAAVALVTALLLPAGAGASLAFWEDYDLEGDSYPVRVWGSDPLTGQPLTPPSTWTAPVRPSTMPDTDYSQYYPPTPAGVPRVQRMPDNSTVTRNDQQSAMPARAAGMTLINVGGYVNDLNGLNRGVTEIARSLFELKSPCLVQSGDFIPTGFRQEDGSCLPIGAGKDALKVSDALWNAATKEAAGARPAMKSNSVKTRCIITDTVSKFDGVNKLNFQGSVVAGGSYDAGQCAQVLQYQNSPQFYATCKSAVDGSLYRPTYSYGSWSADPKSFPNRFTDDPQNVRGIGSSAMQFCPNAEPLVALSWNDDQYWSGAGVDTSPSAENDVIRPGQWINPKAGELAASKTVMETRLDCAAPDGMITTVTVTGNPGTGMVPKPSCPAGTKPNAVEILTAPQTTPNVAPKYYVPLPGGKHTVSPAAREKFPDCLGLSSTKDCRLKVTVDDKDCKLGMADCFDWDSINKNTPERIGCYWGTYKLTNAECDRIKDGYKSPEGVKLDPNNPTAPPAPDKDTIIVPGAPGTEIDLDELFEDPKPENRMTNCLPTGWNRLNPVEWVAQPVGCALRAAFIPSTDRTQARIETLTDDLEEIGIKAVGEKTVSDFQAVGAAASSGGCMGPELVFDVGPVHQVMHLWQACSEPMSTVAGISKALTSMLMVLGGSLGCMRAIGEGFGFRFSLRGGSGDN